MRCRVRTLMSDEAVWRDIRARVVRPVVEGGADQPGCCSWTDWRCRPPPGGVSGRPAAARQFATAQPGPGAAVCDRGRLVDARPTPGRPGTRGPRARGARERGGLEGPVRGHAAVRPAPVRRVATYRTLQAATFSGSSRT